MIEAAAQEAQENSTAWHMHVADARGPENIIRERYNRSTIGRMTELGLIRPDLVAVHAVYVDEREVDHIAERNVKVSHNPTANMFLGDAAAESLT